MAPAGAFCGPLRTAAFPHTFARGPFGAPDDDAVPGVPGLAVDAELAVESEAVVGLLVWPDPPHEASPRARVVNTPKTTPDRTGVRLPIPAIPSTLGRVATHSVFRAWSPSVARGRFESLPAVCAARILSRKRYFEEVDVVDS